MGICDARLVSRALNHSKTESIMAKKAPMRQGLHTKTRQRVVGQLLNAKTSRPLPRLIVQAVDLDATPKPADLGYAVADARGHFALTYTASQRRARKESAGQPGRRLDLRVLDRQKHEVHRTIVRANPEPGHVVEVRVPLPVRQEPRTVPLVDLTSMLAGQVPTNTVATLLAALEQQEIRTLADVRRQGGLHHVEGLPVPPDDRSLRLIEFYADLSALSLDLPLHAALIDKGFTSVASIARASRADVVAAAKDQKGGHFKAAQLHVIAKARVGFLNNLLAGLPC
jgi:hypothetical protein